MSPEAFITEQQEEQVLNWIRKKRPHIQRSIIDIANESYKITMVKGEPIVIREPFKGEEEGSWDEKKGDNRNIELLCSNEHARELEDKGIVKFPKPQSEK